MVQHMWQVCSRDNKVFISFNADFIKSRLQPLEQLFPEPSSGSQSNVTVNAFDMVEDDEPLLSKFKPRKSRKSGSDKPSLERTLQFFRFTKNFWTHMTLQHSEKPSVDMVGQLSEVFDQDVDSGSMVLIPQDVHVGCTLRDASVQELVSEINVWTMVSSKFAVKPGTINQEAADLIQQMAEAGAFMRKGSNGFFYPEPETDDAMRYLTNNGLAVPGESPGHFLISEKGASVFTAMTTVGSCVPLDDFQQWLG